MDIYEKIKAKFLEKTKYEEKLSEKSKLKLAI